jgi:hypothetical protein
MMTSLISSLNRVIVSPNFPLEWRDVDDFLGEFGPFNGRYVPRYPNDWVEKLRHHLADIESQKLPLVKRAALFERLRREIALCTTPVSWTWDESKTWGNNVAAVLDSIRDAKVVGDALDPSPFTNWANAAGDIKRSRLRSWGFQGLVSEYVHQCSPLLVNSPAAYLIDPYLDPFAEACENLLLYFFELVKGSKCYRVELITRQSACGGRERSDPKTWMKESEIHDSLDRIYRQRIPKDRSLVVHLVQEPPHKQEGLIMHDRFFLTMYGAINFGQGFMKVSQKQSTQNAFVVDRDHHAILKEVYINGVARFSENLPQKTNIPYPKYVSSFVVLAKN